MDWYRIFWYFTVADNLKLVFFTSIFIGIFSLFAWIFLPSKRDALIIIVGGSVGNFVNRDTFAANIPKDLTKYLHKYMQKKRN